MNRVGENRLSGGKLSIVDRSIAFALRTAVLSSFNCRRDARHAATHDNEVVLVGICVRGLVVGVQPLEQLTRNE